MNAAVFNAKTAQIFERFSSLRSASSLSILALIRTLPFRNDVARNPGQDRHTSRRHCLIILATAARSVSATLQAKRVGFEVRRKNFAPRFFSAQAAQ